MVASDVTSVPLVHQGTPSEVLARITDLGSCAMLAFDGDRHIGQLQFRRYEPGTRSTSGVWDPHYWMDFGNRAPALPPDTLCVCCYHVGQLDDSPERDGRYQGRGIGARLLQALLDWARAREFAALIAKGAPSNREVMRFLGGLPEPAYRARGFETVVTWRDKDLERVVRQRRLAGKEVIGAASTVACCVLRMSP